MSLRIDDDAPSRLAARARARKLAVARGAPATSALVWMLLGFLLGAGAAVAVLMRADFTEHASIQPVRLSLTPPAAPAIVPAVQLAPVDPDLPKPIMAPAAVRAAPARSTALAEARPAPAASPQVVEDATATGMTSRQGAKESDLY